MTTERGGVEHLRRIARLWDDLVPLPLIGRRIGLDSIVGLIPGVGDLAGGAMGLYGMLVAARLRVSPLVLLRMLLNIAIDTVIGVVPLLGDLFDLGWKSNTRNLALVEDWMNDPAGVRRSSAWVLAVTGLGVLAAVALVVWAAVRLIAWMFSSVPANWL